MTAETTTLMGQVDELTEALPQLVDRLDDPDGVELAAALYDVRQAREQLQTVERELERETAKALSADQLEVAGLFRVERRRSRDRREWDHEAWRDDARRNVLRRKGLLRTAGVLTEDGEVVDVSLSELLREVEQLQGKGAPRVTALRDLGLDPDDYCTTAAGHPRITFQPLAAETDDEGADDAR